jgi:lysozyme
MLSQLLSKLFPIQSPNKSVTKSLESLPSSASLQAPLQESSSNQSLITKTTNQLKRHEGFVSHAYKDSLGYLTIGYGRLIDKAKGGGITEPEAEYLLANDINKVYDALTRYLPYFQTLTQPRQAVLLNMAFQMGTHGLMQFKNTLRLIENGDYSDAADNMLQSLWAQQTPNRAHEMAEQMRSGQWQSG